DIFSGHLLQRHPPPPSLPISTPAPALTDSPFTEDLITSHIYQLARQKAPGSDSITTEMLRPISVPLAPLLLTIFNLCWTSGLTPSFWRNSQVIPIHKKGDPTVAANFRPISLTSTFRKLLEKCLQSTLIQQSPPLDITQGGFRPHRSTLDQVLCLTELCRHHRLRHKTPPTLAFLDIKSAYDTVDRTIIWTALQSTVSPPLLRLIQHLFDHVTIEVLINNHRSRQFRPTTGVLQGSILSPFLYSIYINSLPSFLRSSPLDLQQPFTTINCLLYADDVVLIGTAPQIQSALHQCSTHSHQLGYRWNPTKSIILSPPTQRRAAINSPSSAYFTLYRTSIPTATHFNYLGIPIKPGGQIDTLHLIRHNTAKARRSMNILANLGVRATGYSRLLSCRFYQQFIRPQMEYGLAITIIPKTTLKHLERTQNHCLRQIFRATPQSSTIIMRHLNNIPTMTTRHRILQLKFISRTIHQPADTLLATLIPFIPPSLDRPPRSLYIQLSTTPHSLELVPDPTPQRQKAIIRQLHLTDLAHLQATTPLINSCRPHPGIDPIMKIPMPKPIRSKLLRWRLGWLPSSYNTNCHCGSSLTKQHAITCLNMHRRLRLSTTLTDDPLSFLLNRLPHSPPRSHTTITKWKRYWPTIHTILLELEFLQHPSHIEPPTNGIDPFLVWLTSSPLLSPHIPPS
ncbi:hypothetical protein, partial, partial [Absidia glauca]